MKDSLSQEALGHDGELPPAVFDQMAALGHHHVVELLSFLCDHNVSVSLHSQFETWTQRKAVKTAQQTLKEVPTTVKMTKNVGTEKQKRGQQDFVKRVLLMWLKKICAGIHNKFQKQMKLVNN